MDDNGDGKWEAFHSDKNEDAKVEVILLDTKITENGIQVIWILMVITKMT